MRPRCRPHAGERRRHDVDLVAGLADQGAHLRLGGVAPGSHGCRLHIARRADDFGHLAAHAGPAGPRWQAAFQPEEPVQLLGNDTQGAAHRGELGHGCVARLGVGNGDLGILDGHPQAASHAGRRSPAQVLWGGPPDVALTTGRQKRPCAQDAAHGDMPVQQPPVAPDVAAADQESGREAQGDHQPGDHEELEDVGREGHPTMLRSAGRIYCRTPLSLDITAPDQVR